MQVHRTDVLRLFAKHLSRPGSDATSPMLHREIMHALSKIDPHNPLRLMRIVCTQAALTAACASMMLMQSRAHIHHSIEQIAGPAPDMMERGHSISTAGVTNSPVVFDQAEAVGVEAKEDTGNISEEEHRATQYEVPGKGSSQQMPSINVDTFQIHLAIAFTAAGEAGLQHKHVTEMRKVQAEARQAKLDQDAAAKAQQKQKDCTDKSLVACMQSQTENLELEIERLENQVQKAMQPTMAVVTTLCQSKALFRTNKTLRASALLSLMKMMCAHKTLCEDKIFLPLLFTCLGPGHRCEWLLAQRFVHLRISVKYSRYCNRSRSACHVVSAVFREKVDSGLQLSLMAGIADLLNRWANVVDPLTQYFFNFLDHHVQPKKHGIRILTKLILSAMLKPSGQIYKVCYCLSHEDHEARLLQYFCNLLAYSIKLPTTLQCYLPYCRLKQRQRTFLLSVPVRRPIRVGTWYINCWLTSFPI